MTCDEKLKEIFEKYSKVSMLANKNDCPVIRVRNKELSRDMVIHVIPKEANTYEVLCGLRCENLSEIYEVYHLSDGIIALEEYIDGLTVYEISQTGKIRKNGAVKIAKAVSLGLDVLHQNGIVHRDIKPENVMVDSSGKIKLIDYNAARMISSQSQDTVIMGTVGYVAPEQLGITQSDVRTDIYAMGVFINVMVTGLHPSEKLAGGYIGHIVQRCTHVNPDKRYQSAMKLYNALCFA